ncbi:MAG: 4Fe-4S dicluster domain-containing protein [Acidobacteria bacterium]|nr:4Fe-4S dicluster domain-containing protein [Acidobacteriota bacterium]
MATSRRDVLWEAGKFLILGSAAVSSSPSAAPAPTPAAAPALPAYNPQAHLWGMTIDIEKCIGCGNCVRACEKENDVPEGFFRTWVEHYEIDGADQEHPHVTSPGGGKNGFPPSSDAKAKQFFVPKLCNHCMDSPCVQVCPVGATFDSPDGVVLVDESYCLGCRYCIQACPYGCRYINPAKETVDKCSLCYHRITQGLTTACCEACPTQARQLADLKNPKDPVHEFLRKNKVQVLKPHMATRAKVFYRELDGAVR